MASTPKDNSKKTAALISTGAAFIAGLCCFSPLVLFALGLASASFAGGLADTFYHQYKWVFRSSGFLFLAVAYFLWYRNKTKTCSLDEKKRVRNKMLNLFLMSVIIFIGVYVLWLYVIVDFFGIQLGIWG